MHRYSRLAALLFAVSFSLCSSGSAFAQADVPGARKFDEFGDILDSNIAARLDHFANELQEQPNVKGFVIAYRSRRNLPGLSGRLMSLMRYYLIHSRQIEAERIVGVDGGVAGCVAQELWLVPVGTTPKPRDDAYENKFVDTDSARKFDEASIEAIVGSYSQTIYHSVEGLANALRKEPHASAHIIAYSQYWVNRWEEQDANGRRRVRRSVQLDPPGAAVREMLPFKAELVNKYRISPSRIKLVNGGYRKWGEAELWIVPPGAHAPIPTPNSFPKGRR